MNGIRCPQCSLVNLTSAMWCEQCKYSFSELPNHAYVSVPATEYERGTSFRPPLYNDLGYAISPDNETGRKIHIWFRVYCGLFVLVSLGFAALGAYMASLPANLVKGKDPNEILLGGIIYIVLGLIFAAIYTFLSLMPRQPWAWIVGIVALAFGIITCCFLPSIILLIFWCKAENRAYFGR